MAIRPEGIPSRGVEQAIAQEEHKTNPDHPDMFWSSLQADRRAEVEQSWRSALENKKQQLETGMGDGPSGKVRIGMKLESTGDRNMQKAQVKALREFAQREFGVKVGGMQFDAATNSVEGDLTLG